MTQAVSIVKLPLRIILYSFVIQKLSFISKNPPRYPASRNGTNGISVLPFLQNPIIMMPDHTALQIIPIKSVEKNSSGYSTVPSAISSQPSPIPTAPSVRMPISTKRKPVPHAQEPRNISSAIYCPHSSADCKYYDQQKRNLLFLISIHEFIPRNPSTHISFYTIHLHIHLSGKIQPHLLHAPISKQRKLLPVLPNVSAHCRTPDYGICFPVP